MSKAEKTRTYIIEKSAPVFNIKGYSGTTLNDLMLATGLTKGAIYGNFRDKDEVALAVFQHSVKSLNKRVAEHLTAKKTSIEKLVAYTDFYRTNWRKIFEKGGCPVQNASVEADDNILFLKKHVQASIKSWALNLSKIIESGKVSGEVRQDIIARDYAYSIISTLEGGILLSKIMNDKKFLFAALDRILGIINNEITNNPPSPGPRRINA
jgi:TetR/AcrR family transcriptional regulator, transcriptional repressor for nem operon